MPDGSLLIRDVVAALPASPWRDAALALLIVGFGMKIGLVPLHVLDAAHLHGGADSGRRRAERCRRQGRRDRADPLPAARASRCPVGRGAGRGRAVLGAFYGVAVGITQAESEDGAGLFQHQPDGR